MHVVRWVRPTLVSPNNWHNCSRKYPYSFHSLLVRQIHDRPSQWLHEIKLYGYRTAARIDNGRVQLLTRTGLDWTAKYPSAVMAVANLNVTYRKNNFGPQIALTTQKWTLREACLGSWVTPRRSHAQRPIGQLQWMGLMFALASRPMLTTSTNLTGAP
jgi:hypothetical protein